MIYLIRIVKNALLMLTNTLRKSKKAPHYIVFNLEGTYSYLKQTPKSRLQKYLQSPPPSLEEFGEKLKSISADQRIKGVIFRLGQLSLSLSSVQYLYQMCVNLKKDGKEIIFWASSYSTLGYYLASIGDKIYLQTGGNIASLGFKSQYTYLKEALDWVGLEFDFVQISPYKSAGERFMRSKMSEQVKEMNNWLLDSLYDDFCKVIAQNRNLSATELETLIKKVPLLDHEALSSKLIDGIVNEDDLPQKLMIENKEPKISTWDECKNIFVKPLKPLHNDYIAILTVEGSIVDGKSQKPPLKPPLPLPFLFDQQTGDYSFTQAARRVLKDKKAKAVLLMIDSGGGSATSSEAMSSILKKIAAQKPLLALMASKAASGGYYVATPAEHIIAHHGTITGSIGVLSGKVVTKKMRKKLLLNTEIFSRGNLSPYADEEAPFSANEKAKVQASINHTYQLFLDRVANSRNKSKEEIDEIGGGRVYTGAQALQLGLVDQLGSLDDALIKLKQLGQLKENTPHRIITEPKKQIAIPTSSSQSWQYIFDSINRLTQERTYLISPFYWFDYHR